jgi:hypothetical protein
VVGLSLDMRSSISGPAFQLNGRKTNHSTICDEVERERRLELPTSTLARLRSTN